MKTSITRECLGCGALLLSLTIGALSAQARPLALDDLGDMSQVSSPRIAPDAKSIVVVVSRPNYEKNRFE